MSLELILKVLKLRQAALRVTAGKLQRGLDATQRDDRLYDMMGYHGAHTGRIIGRGMQLLNLPKGVPLDVEKFLSDPRFQAMRDEPTAENTLEALNALDEQIPESSAKRGKPVSTDDLLSSLIRPTLYSDNFIIADYAAIEARGVAWMAGDTKALGVFNARGDPYQEFADEFGTTRQIGKIAELGCGYGMAKRKMEMFAKSAGVDLEAAGVSAEQVVRNYRQKHPKIVLLWKLADRALWRAVQRQEESEVGGCHVSHDGETLKVRLPSGRVMNYNNARVEMRTPGYEFADGPKPAVVYSPPSRRHKEDPALWGSKAIENWCQAICRDLCYDALMNCEREGLHPVLHVYDEIVCEDPADRLLDLLRIMKTAPDWARGLPIEAEGKSVRRYTK